MNENHSQTLPSQTPVFQARNLTIYYGNVQAVREVSLEIPSRQITAFIGPSGCGKSTVLRCFNRLNDVINGFRLQGQILYHGKDLYTASIDPVEVRRRIGMVFQRPNPFPKSIFDNVAFAARVMNAPGDLKDRVEMALQKAALWDEVKEDLTKSGLALSGGQKQRLCIARAIAAEPDVLLMDEPCSALDPISTARIEELMLSLKERYTIIIVTHNMQQATRVADWTAFFNAEATESGGKVGYLVEYGQTQQIFNSPTQADTRKYVTGKFG